TVIFDIGNVLVKFDWRPYIQSAFDEETARVVSDAIWKSGYWEEFDRGVLSDAEIVRLMEEAAPEYKREIHMALESAGEYLSKFDYAIPWVKSLKELGYQVVYLSNYGEFLLKMKPEVLDFLPYMDGGLFSCHAKVIKPDLAIYEMLCGKYNLKPEECLFIDDNKANVEAARSFGMHAIRFEGYEQSHDAVMNYLKEKNN
ncbi:MAG: HAD family phosphatase, partial [Lachnospiraceae bacterium]|nr:HAD family phosphatase [Lachnospiraceae bacterium]